MTERLINWSLQNRPADRFSLDVVRLMAPLSDVFVDAQGIIYSTDYNGVASHADDRQAQRLLP